VREPRDMMVPCCHGSLLRPPLHGAWSTWSSIPGSSTHKGEIVWRYVVLIVLAALSFAFAALGAWARAVLSVGLVISALAIGSAC
jgi:hypothetical protein